MSRTKSFSSHFAHLDVLFSSCTVFLVHEGPWPKLQLIRTGYRDFRKNRLSDGSILYMNMVSCVANKRCSVRVERGRVFLCGQTMKPCVHVAIIHLVARNGISVDIISHLSTYSLFELVGNGYLSFVWCFLHLHNRLSDRSLTQLRIQKTTTMGNI